MLLCSVQKESDRGKKPSHLFNNTHGVRSSTLPLTLVAMLVIYVRDVDNEITDSARVTPFVVIPGDQFDKFRIELDSGLSVEDARVCATNTIGRDNFFVGDGQDPFEFFTFRGLPECFGNLTVAGAFLEAYGEINDGSVKSRYTEGHAALKRKKIEIMKPQKRETLRT